ncbi:MAG: glycoside hydrolase family 57 protein [Acidobacteriota bacterium]
MTSLCFLWHMHQPFYKDLWTGHYQLPWTRLHALKDYAGMVRVLQGFPDVHQTFNLVPSMLVQIEDYATGKASDPFFDCAIVPAEDLSEAQRAFVMRYFFQANVERMIYRYPRYGELYERRFETFAPRELRDLQVLSQLVWFDEDVLATDKELQELVIKGRDFSIPDQQALTGKQRSELARVLPVYREFAATKQIEISTTPFYHPILPLLCDSDIAAISRPGITLPSRFCYPGDARVQLERARTYIRETLGTDPVGLWPSEGSISNEALTLAADCGFKWAASDNGVLARTLQQDAGCDVTYQAYSWQRDGREMRLLFRDHYLSDLIGFEYSRMDASAAAEHFLDRIRQNASMASGNALVPIVLDGENAWEWYHANGRPFLRELYKRISDDPHLEAVTVSEALEKADARALSTVVPGSWINANFDIWIGAEEDNRAWELLLAARRAYDEHSANVPEAARMMAFEELLIAEGSDWCWWYGPEHGSDNRPEFDQLFRDHVANVYRALSLEVPSVLAHPIIQQIQEGDVHERPTNLLDITLDGEVTSSFEWMGAGRFRPDPRSGAMHGGGPAARELFYGFRDGRVFVRLDGTAAGSTFSIEFESAPSETRSAVGRVVELEAAVASPRFRIAAQYNGLPASTLPAEGWIDVG